MSGESTGTIPDVVADGEAILAAEASRAGVKTPDAPGGLAVDIPVLGGVKVRRAELVHGATTGETVKLNTFTEDRQREKTGQEIMIRPETVEKYNTVLRTYVTDLNKMAEKPAPVGSTANNLLEHVLQDPTKRSDKLLMDQLSKIVVGEDGVTVTREVNEEGLNNFLTEGKERNWAAASVLLEQEAYWGMLAGGIEGEIDEPFFNRRPKISTDTKNSAILDEIPTLRRVGMHALSKLVVGGLAAGYFAFGQGTTELDLKSNIDILADLKSHLSPADMAYVEARTGLDLSRMSIGAPRRNGKRPVSFDDGYRPVANDNQDRIINAVSARKEFLTQLGIDESPSRRFDLVIDRSVDIRFPEEFIFNDKQDAEGISVRYSMDIMKEYNRLLGAGTSSYDRLHAMGRAREKVMVRLLETQISVERTAKDKEENVTALEKKKAEMNDNPEELVRKQKEKSEKEKEEAGERVIKAKEKQTEAQAKKDKLSGDGSLSAREQKVLSLERQLVQDFQLPLTDEFGTEILKKKADLEKAAVKAQAKLTEAKALKAREIIKHRKDTNQVANDAKQRLLETYVAKGAPPGKGGLAIPDNKVDITEDLKAIGEAHDEQIKQFQAEYDAKNKEFTDFKTISAEYQSAANERVDSITTIAFEEPGQTQELQDAYDIFVNPPGGAPPLLTVDQVKDLSVKELVDKLPATYSDEDKLKYALLAKAESNAIKAEEAAPLPKNQEDALVDVTAAGTLITEYDLLVRPRKELHDTLVAFGMASAEATQKLKDASIGAQKRFITRNQARIDTEIDHYDKLIKLDEELIKAEDEKLRNLGDFDEQIEELDAVITIMTGQEKVFTRAYEIIDEADELAALSDNAKVTTSDMTYSEAERDAGLEAGYYAWMKLVNPDYVRDPVKRGEIFEAMQRVLPPDILAELLNTHLTLGTRNPRTLSRVLNRLNTRGLGGPDIQLVSKQIINHMRDHGLAI